ncbi:MAG: T9SS type A sorting domain-containing protein [Flavobacteriales bacterium]|nr:T9SS type A sorting domain-containing protein [Flavobacteriales bacterium]
MKRTLFALCLWLVFSSASAQSSFLVRNSTWQDFDVEVIQSGTVNVDASEWSAGDTLLGGWYGTSGQQLVSVNRTSSAVPEGDTAYFDIVLSGNTDTVTLKLRLIGTAMGTDLSYSVEGSGFSEPWFDDGNFHEVNTTLAGKSVVIKFKPDNDDSNMDRDVRFAIHDLPVYELDSADFENPNVLNAMYYNIQMLPFGVSGLGQATERATLLPAQISPYQDVVSFAEAFDTSPREDYLIPEMEGQGFIYHTTILNDPGAIPLPWNGGVIIFSRWPIETEEQIDFAECGQAAQDCLANKGVKYARINKLGKIYHVFGTHMDAGGNADDIHARRTQMAEIRDFIADLNLPESEPVIFGGDFNTDPIGSDMDYQAFRDTMDPIIPQHTGYWESNFSGDFGKIIDHAWGDRTHLVPTSITDRIVTVRSLDPVLWDLYDFSDHRCMLGRYTYPDFSMMGADTVICPGDDLTLSVNTDYEVSYQWFKDGNELTGETNASLEFSNALESQSGNYTCLVSYDVVYGNWGDSLTAIFFPDGPDTVQARLHFNFGDIVINEVLCHVGIEEADGRSFHIYPNPTDGLVNISVDEKLIGANMAVYNTVGSQVYSGRLVKPLSTIDLSLFGKGIYLLQLEKEGSRFHQRLVVY